MNTSAFTRFALASALLVGAIVAIPAFAAHDHDHGGATPPAATTTDQAAWLAKAKAEYPLTTCVVSGDKLGEGSMGGPVDYIHKEEGKPDRLVRFCCKDCVKDFRKDPAKYLKLIDDAAMAHQGHSGHMMH